MLSKYGIQKSKAGNKIFFGYLQLQIPLCKLIKPRVRPGFYSLCERVKEFFPALHSLCQCTARHPGHCMQSNLVHRVEKEENKGCRHCGGYHNELCKLSGIRKQVQGIDAACKKKDNSTKANRYKEKDKISK